jgi:hypothetical protein
MNVSEIEDLVRPLYAKKDKMHGFSHILRLKRRVGLYRKDYPRVNGAMLRFLIYFHGLKDWVRENEQKVLDLGFSKEWIAALYRHSRTPRSVEEKLVSDANAWENVGRSGLRKAFAVGRELGRSEEDTGKFVMKELRKVKFYTKRGQIEGLKEVRMMKNILSREFK